MSITIKKETTNKQNKQKKKSHKCTALGGGKKEVGDESVSTLFH